MGKYKKFAASVAAGAIIGSGIFASEAYLIASPKSPVSMYSNTTYSLFGTQLSRKQDDAADNKNIDQGIIDIVKTISNPEASRKAMEIDL
jgi:hypothetical protein